MASSKAGFQQKDDGTLVVFDQWASGNELELGAAEDNLGGLDLDATTIDTPTILNSVQDFRLTGANAAPVSTSYTSTTLYFTPYKGNRVSLYNTGSSAWELHDSSQISLSTSGFTATMTHDIFVYDNSGTLTLESVAWASGITRNTALALQDGVYVKSGDASRRYVGTVYVSGSKQLIAGQAVHYVWNYNNRILRHLYVYESTASWSYNSSNWRSLNNSTANSVSMIQGLTEDVYNIQSNAAAFLHKNEGVMVGIGVNTNASDSSLLRTSSSGGGDGDGTYNSTAYLSRNNIGIFIYYALERSDGTTIDFQSGDSTNIGSKAGIQAWILV